jgi:hypothetical protein
MAFTEKDRPGTDAFIFYARVAELARAESLYEWDILAVVMAHEIGHLLLGGGHSPTGIMRAKWDHDVFILAARRQLQFTPEVGSPFAHAVAAIRVLPHLTARSPRRPSRPQLLPFADSRADPVLILPSPPPFLAGTAGWRHLLRPGGAALLCFPATRDPPGFRSLSKRLANICLAAQRISFSVPLEKAELGLGSRHHLLYGAPRESGAEKEKKVYVSKPRFHHRLRR